MEMAGAAHGVQRPGLVPMVVAGLLVGLAECLFFAFTLVSLQIQVLVWQWLGPAAIAGLDTVAMGIVIAAPLGAGWGVAWLLRRSRRPRAWWRFGLVGPSLLVASTVGVLIAGTLEPVGIALPDPQRLLVFRLAFVVASATAALLCTWTVAWLLRVPGSFRTALLTAAATGGTYLVVALVVDGVPGWHVGSGDKAMVRVALLGNLLAGTVGGAVAFRLLSGCTRATIVTPSPSEDRLAFEFRAGRDRNQ
jgi:hypothetical protein